jgi:hypothetical protein
MTTHLFAAGMYSKESMAISCSIFCIYKDVDRDIDRDIDREIRGCNAGDKDADSRARNSR